MERRNLSLFDQVFVRLEAPGRPMHVAALMIFQLPPGHAAGFVRGLVDSARAAPVTVPPWNRVLTSPSRWQPLPRTVEATAIDLEHHVRHLALPAPGGERELGQMISRLHSQPLDLRRPLWECSYIEGLGHGRFAVYLKLHHALLDGVSGARMIMRSLSAAPEQDTPAFWNHPGAVPQARPAGRHPQAAGPLDLLRAARASLRLYRRQERSDRVTLRSAPVTLLNRAVGPQRRVATQSFALARLKRAAGRAGVSLNDLVLAMVGGSLRRYLMDLGQLPEAPLTAGVAVSTRAAGDDRVGNAASVILATLGTASADPLARLEQVHRSSAAAKQALQEVPRGAVVPYTLLATAPFTLGLLSGTASRLPPTFNTLVSNVPGIEEPRFLCGARLLHLYPVSIVQPGQALNFTCYSHAGQLNFGITACRDAVPRMQRIAVGLETALRELESALGLGAAPEELSHMENNLSQKVKSSARRAGTV
jgi:WS/DGAT/MGAT family acyltransferase